MSAAGCRKLPIFDWGPNPRSQGTPKNQSKKVRLAAVGLELRKIDQKTKALPLRHSSCNQCEKI